VPLANLTQILGLWHYASAILAEKGLQIAASQHSLPRYDPLAARPLPQRCLEECHHQSRSFGPMICKNEENLQKVM
jgi:hypothetical protein